MQDLVPCAEKVAALLKKRGETVAVAESSAGGLLSAALLAVPGRLPISSAARSCTHTPRVACSWTSRARR